MNEPAQQSPTRNTDRADWLNRISSIVVAVLGLMALFVMFGWLPLLTSSGPTSHRAVGQQLAELDLVPLTGDGPPVSAASLRGEIVLLNFWATWCGPCRHELPDIAALHARYAGNDRVRILAVSCDSPPEDLDALSASTVALLEQMDLVLPTYADPMGHTRAAYDQVGGFRGYPTTLLLDGTGTIRAVWVGAASEQQFNTVIEEVLAEAPE